ncbi:MAG TPA: flagella basal body P-ring formation protein FlgA [Allosphingosinicella sp.]|jgi:hypothetical protein
MIAAPLLLAISGASAIVPIKAAAHVELAGRDIRLSDVAELHHLDAATRRRLQSRVVARLPEREGSVAVSRKDLAALIRRSVPGLQPSGVEGRILFRAALKPDAIQPKCSALASPLEAGQAILPSDLVSAPCEKAPARTLVRFDRRAGVTRAAAALPAGTMLGRISVTEAPAIGAGDKLTLLSTSGPVRIERPVVALQPGRAGGKVFVMAADGEVLAAPLAAPATQEDSE